MLGQLLEKRLRNFPLTINLKFPVFIELDAADAMEETASAFASKSIACACIEIKKSGSLVLKFRFRPCITLVVVEQDDSNGYPGEGRQDGFFL